MNIFTEIHIKILQAFTETAKSTPQLRCQRGLSCALKNISMSAFVILILSFPSVMERCQDINSE